MLKSSSTSRLRTVQVIEIENFPSRSNLDSGTLASDAAEEAGSAGKQAETGPVVHAQLQACNEPQVPGVHPGQTGLRGLAALEASGRCRHGMARVRVPGRRPVEEQAPRRPAAPETEVALSCDRRAPHLDLQSLHGRRRLLPGKGYFRYLSRKV